MKAARRALVTAAAIDAALRDGTPLTCLLLDRSAGDPDLAALAARAEDAGVPVLASSERELWRLAPRGVATSVLAIAGQPADVPLAALMTRPGPVWLLAGLAYAGNVGFALRTVEVAGAAGAVVDAPGFEREDRKTALRVSMGAQRFMPVRFEPAGPAIAAARRAGRRIVAVEDSGCRAPWQEDLSAPALFLVGGERDGIPPELLADCDATLRIPMAGFIPAYNVQAAIAMLTGEWLRQVADGS